MDLNMKIFAQKFSKCWQQSDRINKIEVSGLPHKPELNKQNIHCKRKGNPNNSTKAFIKVFYFYFTFAELSKFAKRIQFYSREM